MQEEHRSPGSYNGPAWCRPTPQCSTSPPAVDDMRCSSPSAATRSWRSIAISAACPRIPAEPLAVDLEDGSPWPLPDRRFGAVVVANYLHRPLMSALLGAIVPGGVLLYQTFMVGNERFGKPSRPEFLLKDGELLELVRGAFSVTAYEARLISDPMAMVQRIAARRLP